MHGTPEPQSRESEMMMSDDMLRDMAIGQGYVPKDCYLDGPLVMAIVNEGKDPCKGCNLDRNKCNGRPVK